MIRRSWQPLTHSWSLLYESLVWTFRCLPFTILCQQLLNLLFAGFHRAVTQTKKPRLIFVDYIILEHFTLHTCFFPLLLHFQENSCVVECCYTDAVCGEKLSLRLLPDSARFDIHSIPKCTHPVSMQPFKCPSVAWPLDTLSYFYLMNEQLQNHLDAAQANGFFVATNFLKRGTDLYTSDASKM